MIPDPNPHGYWSANGAVVFRDPDGRGVVFAPWVYGRDPDPADGGGEVTHAGVDDDPLVRVGWHDGERTILRALFAAAEDSPAQLDSYLDMGRVLVARRGSEVVGHLQLVPADGAVELKNMAVVSCLRGRGIGRLLVETAAGASAAAGASRIVVAPAAADTGTLRFYQRCGFQLATSRSSTTRTPRNRILRPHRYRRHPAARPRVAVPGTALGSIGPPSMTFGGRWVVKLTCGRRATVVDRGWLGAIPLS